MANQLENAQKEIEKIVPEDIINALQSGYKVFQGDSSELDAFLKSGGTLLKKASQRFTSTQLILGVAGIAIVAIIAVKKLADAAEAEEAAS